MISTAVQDFLSQTVRELKADVTILCEQYRNLDDAVWASDSTDRAAICAFQERMQRKEADFVRVKMEGIYIYSCYASPNAPIEE